MIRSAASEGRRRRGFYGATELGNGLLPNCATGCCAIGRKVRKSGSEQGPGNAANRLFSPCKGSVVGIWKSYAPSRWLRNEFAKFLSLFLQRRPFRATRVSLQVER